MRRLLLKLQTRNSLVCVLRDKQSDMQSCKPLPSYHEVSAAQVTNQEVMGVCIAGRAEWHRGIKTRASQEPVAVSEHQRQHRLDSQVAAAAGGERC